MYEQIILEGQSAAKFVERVPTAIPLDLSPWREHIKKKPGEKVLLYTLKLHLFSQARDMVGGRKQQT